MSIPFPKLHIATSVMNRILNAMEGEPSLSITTPAMQAPPIPPDPELEGAQIDKKTAAPIDPVAAPPGQENAAAQGMIDNSVLGGSPFDGALVGASGPGGPPAGGMF